MSAFREGYVYRLLPETMWEVARASSFLPYAGVDEKDGYFHLSSPAQVLETARLHYGAHDRLVCAGASPDDLGEDLRWEASRGGDLFPHYYGFLPTASVTHLLSVVREGDQYTAEKADPSWG